MQLEDDIQLPIPIKKKPHEMSDRRHSIGLIDWQQYEYAVETLVQIAVTRYKALYGVEISELAYQMSIWTDAPSGITYIGFETKQHAQEQISKEIMFFRNQQLQEAELIARSIPYNTNPADFLYKEFEATEHPDLIEATKYSFDDEKYKRMMETRLNKSLLRVRDRLLRQGLLTGLPVEEQLWVGVSSPQSWYDYVKPLSLED